MEPNSHNARLGDAIDSRRARREAAQPQPRRSQASHAARTSASHRWLGRTGVLASLAIMTIAMPLTAGAGKADTGAVETTVTVVAQSEQSTLSVLTTQRRAEPAPIIVADTDSLNERIVSPASRSGERVDDGPQCSGNNVKGSNGRLMFDQLCDLDWAPGHRQDAEAARALTELNSAYLAKFGQNICLSSSYRDISTQHALAETKPELAATPGHSIHGWGLAIDICTSSYSSTTQWNWLKANAPIFGYENPAWARRGGGGAFEPWHWEYFPSADKL